VSLKSAAARRRRRSRPPTARATRSRA
jgi:hypothetical protein